MAARRIQFSSCDQCRRSRLGCDALRNGRSSEGAELSALPACTRCRTRGQQCTFEWIRSVRQGANGATASRRRRQAQSRAVSVPSPAASGVSPTLTEQHATADTPITVANPISPSSPESLCTPKLNDVQILWLETIYEISWEAIFGSWMGAHSCPFLFPQRDTHEVAVSISQVCRQLDRWMSDDPCTPHVIDVDAQINQSLSWMIHTFCVRWLPLVSSKVSEAYLGDISRALWRRARRDMLRVINRPSYRSVLTLLLFGLTPVPVGVAEEEEMDGISGQICVQSAMHQVQALRARQKVLRFNGSKVSPSISFRNFSPKGDTAAAEFMSLENLVMWAALTFDTSASLTMGARPMLSSGLFGMESETTWRLVRTCRKLFHDVSQEWRQPGFQMSDFVANQILASASSWKLLAWKVTAVFKEALGDGHDEGEVLRAYAAVTQVFDEYNQTYRDLMTIIQTRIHFLNQETKLRWYVSVLHYHLSILLLVDMVEAIDRGDLLSQLTPFRNQAETWALTCINFAMSNTFDVSLQRRSTSIPAEDAEIAVQGTTTVPLMSIDPYPHHVVASVQLLWKAIRRDYATEKISADVYRNLCQTLVRALQHLPSSSKSVQAAREDAAARMANV